MTVAPAVRRLIDESPKGGIPHDLTPPEQREYMFLLSELTFLKFGLPGPDVHSVTDHLVAVEGGEIVLRVYRPSAQMSLPGHLTLHGGGWKFGSVFERVAAAICRQRCVEANCVVVSVNYRLAPEHPFPTPLDDCFRALEWTVRNAGVLGIDPDNVSIGGSSAGGNLAAAVSLRCRNEAGPRLRFQLLEVPALDLTRETARETMSSGEIPDVPQPTMDDAARTYLETAAQAGDPLASPLFGTDFGGLPPTHVMTAEYDVLRTEGELYAQRLAAAGVPATYRRYPGALHGTAQLTRIWKEARVWQRDAARALRRAHWDADATAGASSGNAAARP